MRRIDSEEYDDYGPVSEFLPRTQQVHQFYGVVDRTWKAWDIEAGVGVGLTNGSDHLTFKLIVAHDLKTPQAGKGKPDPGPR